MNDENMKPSLIDFQKWMMWAITDPRGASIAVTEPNPAHLGARYQAPVSSFGLSFINSIPAPSASRRLDVYAEAYFSRIVEVLADDFLAVRQTLGEDGFMHFVAEYLKVFPSRSTNIGEVGKYFAEFSLHYPELLSFPFLTDLCRLEWLMIESFYAVIEAPFDLAKLHESLGNGFDAARFRFASSVRTMVSSWHVEKLWHQRHLSPRTVDLDSLAGRSHLLIYRSNGFTDILELEAAEAFLLEKLTSGCSLEESLSPEFEQLVGEAEAETKVSKWFESWFKLGLIVDIFF